MREVSTLKESARIPTQDTPGDTEQVDAEIEQAPDKGKPGAKEPRDRMSPIMTEIRNEEERALQELMEQLGPQGSYKITLRRDKPTRMRISGKDVEVAGFLATYDHPIDEEFVQREFGGGTYALKVSQKNKDGSFRYAKGLHRTFIIAGEPNPESLPNANTTAPAGAQPAGGEGVKMVREAFDVLRDEVSRKHDAGPRGMDPAVQMVIDDMRARGRRQDEIIERLQTELTDSHRITPPAADPIKDKMLSSMIDGNQAQVTALQLRQEAELRQLKQSHQDDLARLHDRFDRDMSAARSSHDREIAAIRQSNEVALASAKASFDMQATLLQIDNKRLERTLEELRVEIKELRAKKEKTLPEQIKEMNALKELMSDGEEASEKSAFDKVVEIASSPAAVEGIQRLFAGKEAKATPAAQTPPVAPRAPRVVKSPDGKHTFVQRPDGSLVAAKPKPKVAVPAVVDNDGQVVTPAVVMPEVKPEDLTMLIGYLERAFAAQTDPEIVAQSGRASIPAEILAWIRDNHTEQVNGVDLFMSKVAKLPGTSPLATQSGRNWVRKVGKALVGG